MSAVNYLPPSLDTYPQQPQNGKSPQALPGVHISKVVFGGYVTGLGYRIRSTLTDQTIMMPV